MISPNKIPPSLQWMTYLSFAFWGVAGISLVQFHEGLIIEGCRPCLSFRSCVLLDGSFLARWFGYTPIADVKLAYMVLLGALALFMATEHGLLRYKYGNKRHSMIEA